MLDLFIRLSNKDAYKITKRILERKDYEKHNMYLESLQANIYGIAKNIYRALLDRLGDMDNKKFAELLYLIDNIELDEQTIVDYLKSTIWNYNKKVDDELDKFWDKAGRLMSEIGTDS